MKLTYGDVITKLTWWSFLTSMHSCNTLTSIPLKSSSTLTASRTSCLASRFSRAVFTFSRLLACLECDVSFSRGGHSSRESQNNRPKVKELK